MALEPRRTDKIAKRLRAEEIIIKLRKVDVLVSQGSRVANAIRGIGVTDV